MPDAMIDGRRPAWLRTLRPLLVWLTVAGAGSTAAVAGLQDRFLLNAWVIPLHVCLVATVLACSVLVAAAVVRTRAGRPGLIVAILTVPWFLTLLVVGAHWIGHSLLAEELSLTALLAYLRRAPDLIGDAGVPWVGGLAVAILLAIALIAAAAWVRRPLTSSIAALVDPSGFAIFGRRRPAARAWALFVLTSVLGSAVFWTVKDASRFAGEPLTGLFPDARLNRDQRVQVPARMLGPREDRALAAPTTPSTLAARTRKNVVVIVVDSLRADHVPAYGYARNTTPALTPFISAPETVRARWATSSCSISGCGILAVLASRSFSHLRPEYPTLPDVLGRVGYEWFFLMSGDFTQAFPVLRRMYGSRARLFLDGWTSGRHGVYDDRAVLESMQEVPGYRGQPAFFYVHLHATHRISKAYGDPVYPVDESDERRQAAGATPPFWSRLSRHVFKTFDAASYACSSVNAYDNRVVQADAAVARILDDLDGKGYLANSVVVITADHGESLGERGTCGHGQDLHGESINIPLVIRSTGVGTVREVPYARQIDIAPTVADLAGVPVPEMWQGVSLLREEPAVSIHQTTHRRPLWAVVWRAPHGTYKYMRDSRTGTERLFDLVTDAAETRDIMPHASPDVVSFMRAALDRHIAEASSLVR